MCLSVPAKIESINDETACVSIGGVILKVGLQLIDNPEIGEYVLIHSGFAIQKISEADAKETIRLLRELAEIDQELSDSKKNQSIGTNEVH